MQQPFDDVKMTLHRRIIHRQRDAATRPSVDDRSSPRGPSHPCYTGYGSHCFVSGFDCDEAIPRRAIHPLTLLRR